MNERERMKDRG